MSEIWILKPSKARFLSMLKNHSLVEWRANTPPASQGGF